MLAEGREDEITRVELQEATLSGQSLVERLEKELGRRLRRGMAGRPPKQRTNVAQGSMFNESM
jgi:hypothetical protein